jgi:2-polyprenyl-6-methoxyphenol hydroxylase-like FAD-dependent oxidoreductase
MKLDTEVLIVGAGPTGLMLACQLQRFGVAFKIIDQQPDRVNESRAFGIQARSMEIFQNLSVVDSFLKQAVRMPYIEFFVNGAAKLKLDLTRLKLEDTPFSSLFFLPQSETERILSEHLAAQGVKISRKIRLETFQDTGQSVSAVLKNEVTGELQTISCSYIAGCDGSHSAVRHVLGVAFIGEAYEQNFFLADAPVSWPGLKEPGFMAFFDRQGIFLHAPLANGIARIIGAKIGSAAQLSEAPLTLSEIRHFSEKITHRKITIGNPVWMTRFHLHHRAVKHYRQGRAFLVGDAAHIHSPAGGQGMNTGLQDATNLAWKIAWVLKNNAPTELLETYSQERESVSRTLLKTTDRFFGILTSPHKIFSRLRPWFLSRLLTWFGRSFKIQMRLFRFISELGIYYQENKFVYESVKNADAKFLAGPKAGWRAPDAPLGQTSLFEKLKEGFANILIFVDMPNANRLESIEKFYSPWIKCHLLVLSADTTVIFERYGVSVSGLYFIRPDGYIGFRSSELNTDELLKYLGTVFGKKPAHSTPVMQSGDTI